MCSTIKKDIKKFASIHDRRDIICSAYLPATRYKLWKIILRKLIVKFDPILFDFYFKEKIYKINIIYKINLIIYYIVELCNILLLNIYRSLNRTFLAPHSS